MEAQEQLFMHNTVILEELQEDHLKVSVNM